MDPVDECKGRGACKWNPRHSARWEEAVDAAPWDGDIKVVDCPRCGHPMTVDRTIVITDVFIETVDSLEDPVTKSMLREVLARVEGDAGSTDARCNCSFDHPGHPEDPAGYTWGCGQAGAIRLPS